MEPLHEKRIGVQHSDQPKHFHPNDFFILFHNLTLSAIYSQDWSYLADGQADFFL